MTLPPETVTQDREPKVAFIAGISSDIGAALAHRWLQRGWQVGGTYRTRHDLVGKLAEHGCQLEPCDLNDATSVHRACQRLQNWRAQWDVLVLAQGTQIPVGPFIETPFDVWEDSIEVNLTGQLRIVHQLMPHRRIQTPLGPCVMFFAGGGTNNAVVNYSAYTTSKTALIKMCELLDAEVEDTRFVIIGPGWVKTKIHEPTLQAGADFAHYQVTVDKLAGTECTPIEKVLDHFDWAVNSQRAVIGGRNFSTVHDRWGSRLLDEKLREDPNMYKLRRHGNDALPSRQLGVLEPTPHA